MSVRPRARAAQLNRGALGGSQVMPWAFPLIMAVGGLGFAWAAFRSSGQRRRRWGAGAVAWLGAGGGGALAALPVGSFFLFVVLAFPIGPAPFYSPFCGGPPLFCPRPPNMTVEARAAGLGKIQFFV